MDIRAVAFDVNGTLVRILTDDGAEEIFRAAGHYLTYQGIDLCREQVRELYFRIMAEQQHASPEEYPEFDAAGIWRSIIDAHQTAFTRALPTGSAESDNRFMMRLEADELPGELALVMARLDPIDVETLDTLIIAGIAANRAQAVRWALAGLRPDA
jgi:phosphoglycolate phosphatase-like HAD superfamily hydrolase